MISIPNSHHGNKLKMKVSGLYSSLLLKKISLIFQKKLWWWWWGGGLPKRAFILNVLESSQKSVFKKTEKVFQLAQIW